MKKLLIIVFVLAICILAFPQGVMAAVGDPVPINAQYAQSEVVFTADTVPATGFTWNLLRSDATGYNQNLVSPGLHFTVDSKNDWTVTAADQKDTAAHKGHMVESVSSGAHFLNGLFQIRDTGATPTTYTLDGASPITIQTGTTSLIAFDKAIAQPMLLADHDYASSAGYAITVQFSCSNGFSG